ncbi:MAG: hypothetical protein WA945_08780 [Arcobacteraceae bacterium]
MLKNQNKYKLELFKKYGIKLSDDDPLWLLMIMQKDMSSEILNATKRAQKSVNNIGTFSFQTKLFFAIGGLFFGILFTVIIFTLFQSPVPKPEIIYQDRVVYASDVNSDIIYTKEELDSLANQVFPSSYYFLDNDANYYLRLDRDDSRISWTDEYIYVKITN